MQTSTDQESAASVCRLLVDDCGYESVWVVRKQGPRGGDRYPVVIADHGSDRGFRHPGEGSAIDAATRRTLATDDPAIVTTDIDGENDIVAQLERCGLFSVQSVPLVHEGLSYGALTVVRTDTGSDVAGQLVDEVAVALAFKQQVHRQQEALAGETVTELTLRYTGDHALTALSRALAVGDGDEEDDEFPELVVEELHAEGGPGSTYLVKTADVDTETVRATAAELPSVTAATVVTETETTAVVSIRAETGSIRGVLGGYGEMLRSITVCDGRLNLTVEFPRRTDLNAIVDAVQDHWPEATMHTCTERPINDHPSTFSGLTKKREDTLGAASPSGLFQRPQ